MKFILPLLALLALTLPSFAQSDGQLEAAISNVFSGSGKPNNTDGGNTISTLARGFIGLNNQIAVKTNSSGNLVFEGATINNYQTTFAITDPTAARTITFPNDTGTVALNPLAGTLTFEGTTADAFETILNVVDPTSADGNYYLSDLGVGLADANVTVMVSTINSGLGGPGLATAVWGGVSSVVFEGATADASEAVLDVADVTADVIYRLPDAAAATYSLMSSALATNAVDIANSVTGASNALVFEGATANGFETSVAPTDATADRTVTLPDASGTVRVFISEDVTATNVITAIENGTVFYLNSGTEFVSTLPAPAIGLEFTFIVKAAPSGASYTIVANGSGAGNDVVKGQAHITADAAGDAGTADDTITFVDGQAVAGDMVKVWSDGTSWFAHAFAAVAAGVTFTDVD
jgi:hypothetical protein